MHEHVWKSMSSIMSCHSLYLGMLLPCTIISPHDCQCCILILTRVVHVHNLCAWCFARYVQTMAVFFQILRYVCVFPKPRVMIASTRVEVKINRVISLQATSERFCTCKGGDCKRTVCRGRRSFIIPTSHVIEFDDRVFVKLSRDKSGIRKLMCCLAIPKGTRATDDRVFNVLGKVTVIDQLLHAKEMAVRMAATGCNHTKCQNFKKTWRRNKK